MRMTSILTALLLLFPTITSAQAEAETSGLMLNLHLNGSAVATDSSDDIENGGGLGLAAGWGFSPNFMLYAAGDAASISGADSEPDYSLGHFDLGVRYSFAAPARSWVPFLLAGVSGRAAVWDDLIQGQDLEVTGAGVTAGGGISYFFTPAWALQTSLEWTFGEFSDVTVGDQSANLEQYSFSATSTRFDLGISWHPRGG